MSHYLSHFPERPRFASRPVPTTARIAIIGGGYAGLNTALGLSERGVQGVCLLEANHIGFGASGRNGGFVFAGYSLGEAALRKRLGASAAARLYARTSAAVDLIRSRITQYRIECELVDAGVLWVNWFRDDTVLKARQQLLASHYDSHWEWLDRGQLRRLLETRRYGAALFERNAMHLQPLKYACGLAQAAISRGASIHEQVRVQGIEALTSGGFRLDLGDGRSLLAEQLVLACGGYLGRLEPRLARAVLPIATYVMSTAADPRIAAAVNTDAAIYDSRFAFDYYRRISGPRLLWGGRISIRERAPAQVARLLKADLLKVYPQLAGVEIDHAWSGLMSYARHEMPQLGQLAPGFWYAQGFGGHGLAPTVVAGELLAAAIAQDDPGWREFSAFGLSPVFGRIGLLAAQWTYSWLQLRDRLRR